MTKRIFAWIVLVILTSVEISLIYIANTIGNTTGAVAMIIVVSFFSLGYLVYVGVCIAEAWESLPASKDSKAGV